MVAAVAVEYQIITIPVFVSIVLSAIISSLIVGPWLMWSIRRRPAMNIAELFVRRALMPHLTGLTRQAVIQELCQEIAEHHHALDPEAVFAAVQAREELMGTGVGSGIAIPHARLAALSKPVITCGRAPAGIDWDAPDGVPVQLVFLLLTPVQDEGAQLQILAAIARTMSVEETRRDLVQAEDAAELWQRLSDVLRSADAQVVPQPRA